MGCQKHALSNRGAIGTCLASEHKEERQMAVLLDPFEALTSFQLALDAYRTSSWLDPGLSGSGAYPPLNVFRKGDDFIIVTELPGVKKADLDVQVKGRTIRLSGEKTVGYPEKAALHRRERLAGRFDRAVTMPVEIDPEGLLSGQVLLGMSKPQRFDATPLPRSDLSEQGRCCEAVARARVCGDTGLAGARAAAV